MDAAQVGVRRFRLQKDSMSKAITLCCGNALDELYSMVVKAFSTCFELSNACGSIRPLIVEGTGHTQAFFQRPHDYLRRVNEFTAA